KAQDCKPPAIAGLIMWHSPPHAQSAGPWPPSPAHALLHWIHRHRRTASVYHRSEPALPHVNRTGPEAGRIFSSGSASPAEVYTGTQYLGVRCNHTGRGSWRRQPETLREKPPAVLRG